MAALCKLLESVKDHFDAQAKSLKIALLSMGHDNPTKLVELLMRLLAKRGEFASKGDPTHIDIGYHYTESQNMNSIRAEGLLTATERRQRNINSKLNGSALGDGIYTCDDPDRYHKSYGDVGILLARLQGPVVSSSGGYFGLGAGKDFDPNKTCKTHSAVVPRTSAQCVPLLAFSCANRVGAYITSIQSQIQSLIDSHFNVDIASQNIFASNTLAAAGTFGFGATAAGPTSSLASFGGGPFGSVTPAVPPFGTNPFAPSAAPAPFGAPIVFTAPAIPAPAPAGFGSGQSVRVSALNFGSDQPAFVPVPANNHTPINKTLTYVAPETLNYDALKGIPAGRLNPPSPNDKCGICLDGVQIRDLVGLAPCCKQIFHHECIVKAMSISGKCPTCATSLKGRQGSMPSGGMTISLNSSTACSGHAPGTITIQYSIPSGTQKAYHRLVHWCSSLSSIE